jgi:hypothetical protein
MTFLHRQAMPRIVSDPPSNFTTHPECDEHGVAEISPGICPFCVEEDRSREAVIQFLHAADYYIAGLQAVQRRTRVTNLDERHVGYDHARATLRNLIAPEQTNDYSR